MAVNTIGSNLRPIDVDELGIGVTPVWGARSLRKLGGIEYVFSTGLIDTDNTITVDLDYVMANSTFAANIPVILSSGKSLGKYVNGDTIPAVGLTPQEVLIDIATEYLVPVFSSFSVTGQSTTVEVGTTLTGSKTFTWGITENSGTVDTLSIYDVTEADYIGEDPTANDGSEAATITEIILDSYGATQQWIAVGYDTGTTPTSTVDSSTFTVTARYYRYYGPAASIPTDSAGVKALPESAFHTNGASFSFETGVDESTFVIALPPDRSIIDVFDVDTSNANITTAFSLATVSVADAGGTNRTYRVYSMTNALPYEESHTFSVTTS